MTEKEPQHGIKNGIRIGVLTVGLVVLGYVLCKLPDSALQILSMISSVLAVVSVELGIYSVYQANEGAEQIKEISDKADQAVQAMEKSIDANNKTLEKLGEILDKLGAVSKKQDQILVDVDALKLARTNQNQDEPPSMDQVGSVHLISSTGEVIPWSKPDTSQ